MKLTSRQETILDNLGWSYTYSTGLFSIAEEGNSVYLSQESPAGEDFGFDVSLDNFVEEVKAYAAYFDVDEHVELWIDSRGKGGCPSSVRELVEDAEAIDKMLQELAAALLTEEANRPVGTVSIDDETDNPPRNEPEETYTIVLSELRYARFELKARDKEAAKEKARRMWECDEIDYCGSEITELETEE